MTTLPNPAKSQLLFCLGALMAAENEESADTREATLLAAALRALNAPTASRTAQKVRPFIRQATKPASWLLG